MGVGRRGVAVTTTVDVGTSLRLYDSTTHGCHSCHYRCRLGGLRSFVDYGYAYAAEPYPGVIYIWARRLKTQANQIQAIPPRRRSLRLLSSRYPLLWMVPRRPALQECH